MCLGAEEPTVLHDEFAKTPWTCTQTCSISLSFATEELFKQIQFYSDHTEKTVAFSRYFLYYSRFSFFR